MKPPRPLPVVLSIPPLLDDEFDEIDEQVLAEPPLHATRRCGGKLTRLTDEPEDDQ